MINNDYFYLYYLPRVPVGVGITVVDDVSVGEETGKDNIVVERNALLVERSGVSLAVVPLGVSV